MITGNSCEDCESVLGRLYESYSESNAMYDDEIKADFPKQKLPAEQM